MHHDGTVLSVEGGVYDVRLDDGSLVRATLRGRLKLEARTGGRVVAGDRVAVRLAEGGGAIERVEPRRTLLARRAPGRGGRKAKAIVANVDQLVAVFAAADPEPNRRMLDRFLVLAEAGGLDGVVVLNKSDLTDDAALRERFRDYPAAGYPLVIASAATGAGVDRLRDRVCGRTSTLAGPSGVGKSSLLNALEPGLALRTAGVSGATRKGQHTTVTARLIPLSCGGFLADTPGLRELGLWGVPAGHLDRHFPELRPYLGECRFGGGCTHTHEPACAVREAVAAGDVSSDRYESYRTLLEEGQAAGG